MTQGSKNNSCTRKLGYDTKNAALDARCALNRRGIGRALTVYPCRFCRKWHIGHWQPSGGRKKR